MTVPPEQLPSIPPPPEPPASGNEGPAPAPDAPAAGSRWARLSRTAVLAVGVVLGAAITGGCWLIVSLAGGDASSAEKTFGTSGTLTLADSSLSFLAEGEDCTGLDGYSDIHRGAQVNVTGADGTLVATGELEAGKKTALGCGGEGDWREIRGSRKTRVPVHDRGDTSGLQVLHGGGVPPRRPHPDRGRTPFRRARVHHRQRLNDDTGGDGLPGRRRRYVPARRRRSPSR